MHQTRELLTTAELADRLKVSLDTVRRWRQQGIIPAIDIHPTVIRFDFEEVVQALRTRSHGRRAAS